MTHRPSLLDIKDAAIALITAYNHIAEIPPEALQDLADVLGIDLVMNVDVEDDTVWVDITTLSSHCYTEQCPSTGKRRYKAFRDPDGPWSSAPLSMPHGAKSPLVSGHETHVEGQEHVCRRCGKRWDFDDTEPPCD